MVLNPHPVQLAARKVANLMDDGVSAFLNRAQQKQSVGEVDAGLAQPGDPKATG
jgi:hypothetical protein